MSIITNRLDFSRDFTQIHNSFLRDGRLTLRARGLLGVLLSQSDGWDTSVSWLIQSNPEGRDAIKTAIRELVEFGYLAKEPIRDEGGRLAGSYYFTQVPPDRLENRSLETNTLGGGLPVTENRPQRIQTKNTKNTNGHPADDRASDGYAEDFATWWKHYPRKVHKAAAQRKFKQAMKRTDLATLIQATDRYAAEVKGTEPRFVKGPDAWLNDDRWLDYGERPSKDLTLDEVNEVLGLDSWEPEWPSEGFTDLNAERAWLREQRERRFEYRKQLALERITNGAV